MSNNVHSLLKKWCHTYVTHTQLPTVVSGSVLGYTPHGQAFASTESVLEMGMCGGPVLNAAGKCVGATEGVVPETGPEPLRLCAAVITAPTISMLLAHVEEELRSEVPPRQPARYAAR